MRFRAKTCDRNGGRHTVSVMAGSQMEAIRQLEEQDMIVLDLAARPGRSGHSEPMQMIIFTRQLFTLLQAGLPILRALDILAGQAKNKWFQDTLKGVQEGIRAGESLGQAMGRYPEYFSSLYTSLVGVGEISGRLPEVLHKTKQYLEREHEIKMKIRNAALYPALMLVLAVLAFMVILTFVLPVFADLFARSEVALPGVTRMLLGLSAWLGEAWLEVILAVVVLAAGFIYWIRTDKGRKRWHWWCLRVPLGGEVNRQVLTGQLAFVLALLIRAGVPLLQALRIAQSTIEMCAIRRCCKPPGCSCWKGKD